MATVVNDRDVLIINAAKRYSVATDQGMFVAPSSAVFKVLSSTTGSPGAFTFTATLLGMTGTVDWSLSWTPSAGKAPVISGNTLTLSYQNFEPVSGTITATITVDGQTYTQVATVSKVADGTSGLPGSRGNVDIAAKLEAGAPKQWDNNAALKALTDSNYGAPMNRDLVKLYKDDKSWSEQRMYDGTNWVNVDYVYDGSVFVKGSILPESIDTRGLSIKDAQGNIILAAGNALPTGYAADGTLNSDLDPKFNGLDTPYLRWDFATDLDSFTVATDSTLTWDPATQAALWTPTAANGSIRRTLALSQQFLGRDYTKLRARVKRISGTGTWEGRAFYTTAGHTWSSSYYAEVDAPTNPDVWNILEWDMAALVAGGTDWMTNTITGIRFDLINDFTTSPATTWAFDWVAIGKFTSAVSPSDVIAARNTAEAAKSTAAAANTLIGKVVDDDVITAGTEKANINREYNAIVGERNAIRTQAVGLGLVVGTTPALVDYDAKYSALTTYKGTITNFANLTVDSAVDGTTLATRFSDYYVAKQALLNAMAAAAATRADWSGIANIPYSTIANNDDSASLGFNPGFVDWPAANTYPTGWSVWNTAPARETVITKVGNATPRWVTNGTGNFGMTRAYYFRNNAATPVYTPLPAGTFISGSVDMYLASFTAGPGMPYVSIRLFVNSALSTFRETRVPITALTTGAWQRMPFTARTLDGEQIFAIQIYIFASYTNGAYGACTCDVIVDNLRFALFDNSVDNTNISLASDGTLTTGKTGGGGKVTITGLGYSGALNATYGATIGTNLGGKFTSVNIGTYMSSAAIDIAYIDTASITALTALSSVLGTVAVGTGGYLRQGQTGYDIGTGFWLGDVNGTPKFSIGQAGGSAMLWNGSNLTLRNPTISSGFNVAVNSSVSGTRSNGATQLGSVALTVTGGLAPYAYSWVVTSEGAPGTVALSSYGSASASVSCSPGGTNTRAKINIAITVTDANGLAIATNVTASVTWGTPA